jgi:hypothetical protein
MPLDLDNPTGALALEYKARKVTCPSADPTPWLCNHGYERKACYVCLTSKGITAGGNILTRAVKSENRFYSLTLTHPQHDRAPGQQAKFLRETFKALRRCASFRPIVGGVLAIDVQSSGNGSNVHIHVLAETTECSADIEHAITNDWRRLVGADGDAAPALFKRIESIEHLRNQSYYVGGLKRGRSKLSLLAPVVMNEWNKATKGMRARATFGTFRGTKLTARTRSKAADATEPPQRDDEPCQSLAVAPRNPSANEPTETPLRAVSFDEFADALLLAPIGDGDEERSPSSTLVALEREWLSAVADAFG